MRTDVDLRQRRRLLPGWMTLQLGCAMSFASGINHGVAGGVLVGDSSQWFNEILKKQIVVGKPNKPIPFQNMVWAYWLLLEMVWAPHIAIHSRYGARRVWSEVPAAYGWARTRPAKQREGPE